MASMTDAFVPIAQLDPSLDLGSHRVRGVVSLVWPYSASKRTFSVLLVEPDFRLRQRNGQVRITFKRSCAKALARAGIASGDEVNLSLASCKFFAADKTIQTPGKGIEWELGFDRNVWLEIRRKDVAPKVIAIDRGTNSPEPLRPFTPPPPRTPVDHASPISLMSFMTTSSWTTPAFLKRKKRDLSISLASNTQYDMFADEELASSERAPKRVRFSGTQQWRVAGKSPSPERNLDQSNQPKGSTSDQAPTQEPVEAKNLSSPFEPPASLSPKGDRTVFSPSMEEAVQPETEEATPQPYPAETQTEASFTSSILSSGQETPSFPPDDHPASQLTFGSGFTENSAPYFTPRIPHSSWTSPRRQFSRIMDRETRKDSSQTEDMSKEGLPTDASPTMEKRLEELAALSYPNLPDEGSDTPVTQSTLEFLSQDSETANETSANSMDHMIRQQDSDTNQRGLGQISTSQPEAIDRHWLSSPTAFSAQPATSTFDLLPSPTAIATPSLTSTFFNFDTYADHQEGADILDATFIGTQGLDAMTRPAAEYSNVEYPQLPVASDVPVRSFDPHQLDGISVVRDFEPSLRYKWERQAPLDTSNTNQHAMALAATEESAPEREIAISDELGRVHMAEAKEDEIIPKMTPATPKVTLTNKHEKRPIQRVEPEVIELSSGDEGSEAEVEEIPRLERRESHEHTDSDYAEQGALSSGDEQPGENTQASAMQRQSSNIVLDKQDGNAVSDGELEANEGRETRATSADSEQSYATEVMTPSESEIEFSETAPQPSDPVRQTDAREDNSDTLHEEIEITVLDKKSSPSTDKFKRPILTSIDSTETIEFSQSSPDESSEQLQVMSKPTKPNETEIMEEKRLDGSEQPIAKPSELLQEARPTPLEAAAEIPTASQIIPPRRTRRNTGSYSEAKSSAGQIAARPALKKGRKKSVSSTNNPSRKKEISDALSVEQNPRSVLPRTEEQAIAEENDSASAVRKITEKRETRSAKRSELVQDVSVSQSGDLNSSESKQTRKGSRNTVSERLRAFRKSGGALQDQQPFDALRERRTSKPSVAASQARSNVVNSQRSRKKEAPVRLHSSPVVSPEPKVRANTRSRRTRRPSSKDIESPKQSTIPTPDPASAQLLAETTANAEPLSSFPIKKGIRTSHAYYTPLSNLHQHVNSQVDALVVIVGVSKPEKATLGPRHWHMTLYATDTSLNHSDVNLSLSTIQVFRPSKRALPQDTECGDILLLHSFKCTTRARRPMLISDMSSGWIVFSASRHQEVVDATGHVIPGQTQTQEKILGPPLDHGTAELDLVARMHDWWDGLGDSTREELSARAVIARETAKEAARRRSRRKGVARPGEVTHELRNGSQYPYTDTPLVWSDEDLDYSDRA